MRHFEQDSIVIGAGVIGLACAAALARSGAGVLVVEKEASFGRGISSRNSEVIHSGLYYPHGSLKHRMCVEGRERLYPFLGKHGIPHRKTGKLVVAATSAEMQGVEQLYSHAREGNVAGVRLLGLSELRRVEPAVLGAGALLSEETGIVDGRALMNAILAQVESFGGTIVYRTPLVTATPRPQGGFDIVLGGDEPCQVRCRQLVNAAGLYAVDVAKQIGGGRTALEKVEPQFVKGSYFSCAERSPFEHLIYPMPPRLGLGIHLTLDLRNRMRFGPDVELLDTKLASEIDFNVDPRRVDGFYAAIRRYWPALPQGSLTPDYAGCRPRFTDNGTENNDFHVDGPNEHGIEGLVNLLGIESPGLTSALAIAEAAAAKLAFRG